MRCTHKQKWKHGSFEAGRKWGCLLSAGRKQTEWSVEWTELWTWTAARTHAIKSPCLLFYKHLPLAATQSVHAKRSHAVESSSSYSSSLVWHFICNPADVGVDGRGVEIERGKGPECHLEVYWCSQQVDAGVIMDDDFEWPVQLCDQSEIRV